MKGEEEHADWEFCIETDDGVQLNEWQREVEHDSATGTTKITCYLECPTQVDQSFRVTTKPAGASRRLDTATRVYIDGQYIDSRVHRRSGHLEPWHLDSMPVMEEGRALYRRLTFGRPSYVEDSMASTRKEQLEGLGKILIEVFWGVAGQRYSLSRPEVIVPHGSMSEKSKKAMLDRSVSGGEVKPGPVNTACVDFARSNETDPELTVTYKYMSRAMLMAKDIIPSSTGGNSSTAPVVGARPRKRVIEIDQDITPEVRVKRERITAAMAGPSTAGGRQTPIDLTLDEV